MKFKSIFWLFNSVVLAALVLFASASFMLFGQEYAAVYWSNMWLVVFLFLVLIAGLDAYFIKNWSLFSLLEAEDWPALLAWLENQLYGKRKLRKSYANLLINTALSVSNLEAVKKLEKEVREQRPDLLKSLGVSLGIPLLLEQNWPAVVSHYGPLADDPAAKSREWARWCHAVGRGGDGTGELTELLQAGDVSVRLLSFQALSNREKDLDEASRSALASAGKALRQVLVGAAGERVLTRSREDCLLAVVLSSRVKEVKDGLVS